MTKKNTKDIEENTDREDLADLEFVPINIQLSGLKNYDEVTQKLNVIRQESFNTDKSRNSEINSLPYLSSQF